MKMYSIFVHSWNKLTAGSSAMKMYSIVVNSWQKANGWEQCNEDVQYSIAVHLQYIAEKSYWLGAVQWRCLIWLYIADHYIYSWEQGNAKEKRKRFVVYKQYRENMSSLTAAGQKTEKASSYSKQNQSWQSQNIQTIRILAEDICPWHVAGINITV